MTQGQYEKAQELKSRIMSIDILINHLTAHDYKQEPPTRQTGWGLIFNSTFEKTLNEGEVVTILEALKAKKQKLEIEFKLL